MSLARRVIEKRRRRTIGGDGAQTRGHNDTGERLESANGRDQRYSTDGHRMSDKASEMHQKHMVEHKESPPREHKRKRRIIHGGTHGNDYMPPETRGEL